MTTNSVAENNGHILSYSSVCVRGPTQVSLAKIKVETELLPFLEALWENH